MEDNVDRGFYHFLLDHKVDLCGYTYFPAANDIDRITDFYENFKTERIAPRCSGGTTLILMLALYGLYAGRSGNIFVPTKQLVRHVLDTALNIEMDFFDVKCNIPNKQNGAGVIELKPPHHESSWDSYIPNDAFIQVKIADINSIRGYNFKGNIFIDNLTLLDFNHRREVVDTLAVNAASNKSRMMINH